MSLLERRFWSQVTKTDSCWVWTGYSKNGRYGCITYEGRQQQAHVVSYKMHKGDVGDLKVLHSCDNPRCVNPAHLELGTQKINMQQASRRGRLSSHGVFKIDPSLYGLVKEIYHETGASFSAVARLFGVTDPVIAYIVKER